MSLTHTHVRQITRSGGVSVTGSKSVTFEQEIIIDTNVAQSQTDLLHALAVDVSQMKSLYIKSDQNLTLETNDGTTPDDTIAVVANQPIVWMEGDTQPNPLTVDVDGLYVTTGAIGTAGANLVIIIGVDPTV